MKNKILLISGLLLVFVLLAVGLILYACTQKNTLQEGALEVQETFTETEEQETATAEEKETEEVKLEGKAAFEELIKDNLLDADYESENTAVTISAMRAYQKKYADLWLKELQFSCKSYAALLGALDREKFLYYEEKWEKAALEEYNLITSIYSGSAYDLNSDLLNLVERDADYVALLRERALYVKYLQFSLETVGGEEATVAFLYGSPTPPVIENEKEEPKVEEDLKNEEAVTPDGSTTEEDSKESAEAEDKSDAKNTIITNQKDPLYKNVKIESGTVGENGCGAVAIHNVKVLKGVGSTLSETIRDIQGKYGLIVNGYLGVNPFIIDDVLKDYGISCTTVKAKDLSTPGLYLIAFWNNPKNLGDGAHYVVLQVNEDSFEVINGDQNGPAWYSDKYIYGYRIN